MSSIKLNGKVRYENLGNEFNDAEEFLIDGDSLLLSVVNDENFNMIYGGQSLQLLYIIERKLKLLVQRGAKFTIIFLKFSNCILWSKCVSMQLFREVLMYHLSLNLSYKVLRDFEELSDMKFIQYLNDTKPSMIILSYDGIQMLRAKFFDLNEKLMQRIQDFLKVQINDYLKLEINVSFIERLHLTKAGLFGDILMFQPNQLETEDKSKLNTANFENNFSKKEKIKQKENCSFVLPFISHPQMHTQSITIQLHAGIEIFQCLQKQYPGISKDLVKIYFIYIAIKENVPLRHRSYGESSNVSIPEAIFSIFHKSILQIWCKTEEKSDSKLVDIWSGNLYVKVLETCLECCDSSKQLDKTSSTMLLYQKILDTFAKAIGIKFEPFPVIDLEAEVFKFYKKRDGNDKSFEASSESMQILRIDSELQTIYAGELYKKLDVVGVEEDRDFDIEPEFLDEYHWHGKKSLIDYDVLKTIMIQRKKEWEDCTYKKKVQRGKNRLALAKQRYSEFISGSDKKILIPSVKSKEDKKRTCKKKVDVSKKAEEIIGKNKERQRQEKDVKTKRAVKDLVQATKRLENQNNLRKALENLEKQNDSKNIAFNCSIVKYKIKLLIELGKVDKKNSEQIEYMRKLILIVRDLSDHKKLSENKDDVMDALNRFKLFKLSFLLFQEANLNQSAEMGICHIEFQMKHMSQLLRKKLREDPDPRVKYFVPDQWQRDMFDYIDANQSVLIVAPTSSGKTFASYYCMEKILRSSDEDVIVYVSPTKALCNQVMATVNSLFEKPLPNGKKLCGVFTRDFHEDIKNCQILVTVPQCFELLLLSAESFDWSNKIKYVIFDEIHCIGSEDGAEVWEHLLLMIKSPFLALSATVENPDLLQSWLQTSQEFLKERNEMLGVKRSMESYQVKLIKVEGRYSDLEKYQFSQESCSPLKKIHPISSLDPKVVAKHGIPDHLFLSANECLSLYDESEKLFPEENIFPQLSPNQYFEHETFLTRDVITDYSVMLKDNLSKWLKCHHDNEKFEVLQKALTGNCATVGPLFSDIRQSFVKLLLQLQESDILPCIVFVLNRTMCEDLTNAVINYCTYQEDLYQKKHKIKEVKTSTKEKCIAKKEKYKVKEEKNRGYLIFSCFTLSFFLIKF